MDCSCYDCCGGRNRVEAVTCCCSEKGKTTNTTNGFSAIRSWRWGIALLVTMFLTFIWGMMDGGTVMKRKETWKYAGSLYGKDNCSCSCWDTVSKGRYSHRGYKYIYLNVEVDTFVIILFSVIFLGFFIDLLTRLIAFAFESRKYVPEPVIIVAAQSFAHCYSFWMVFNYVNDSWYNYWKSQMFFSLTEIISTLACYHISERSNTPPNFTHFHAVAIILGVSAAHLILSWRDQALQHFIGVISADMPWMGLVARDLLFSLGDAIAFLLALRLWYFAEQRRLIAGESTLIGLFLIMGYMFFARDY